MNAILSITGSVKGVDPQGFALVGGIAFAIAPAQLPKKGQIVKIEAQLAQAPAAADDQPIWTATSVIAFDMPQAQAAAPVEVPQRTDHHNTVSSPAAPAPAAAATPAQPKAAAAPAATSRFGAAPTKPKAAPAQTPAPSAAAIAQHAVTAASTTSRFQRPAAAAAAPAAAQSVPAAQPARRFGAVATSAPAAPAARPAAQPAATSRPPFTTGNAAVDAFEETDIPF